VIQQTVLRASKAFIAATFGNPKQLGNVSQACKMGYSCDSTIASRSCTTVLWKRSQVPLVCGLLVLVREYSGLAPGRFSSRSPAVSNLASRNTGHNSRREAAQFRCRIAIRKPKRNAERRRQLPNCPSAADRAFARCARVVAVVGAVWIGAALANLFADMRFYLGWTLLLAPSRRARRTRRTLIAECNAGLDESEY
jgi:hypothetical protein